MDAFFEWFRWLYETTGINLTIFYDAFDRKRFVGVRHRETVDAE